jgi:hypothetical protein
LSNQQTVKLIQANAVLALNEYEKSKCVQTKQGASSPLSLNTSLLSNSFEEETTNSSNSSSVNGKQHSRENNKFAQILHYSSELHAKICEKTLEMILFKYFIGDLNMRKIVLELFKNYN